MKFLNRETKSVSFASLILVTSYLLSAILGVTRDRLLAGKFGFGSELDVYYAAFTIPDFIALILIFGAISAAIIPIFSSYWVDSKEEAWRYVSNILNVFLTFLIVVCVISIIFAPLLVNFIAPGFSDSKKEMTVMLMRIMFLSPIILGTSGIVGGILQVFRKFLVTALAPILYNVGIIIGILFFVPRFGLQGLAMGVVLGALLHLAIQLPVLLYSGFKYQPIFDLKNPGVIKTLKLMIPRSLGLGAGQFNTIVITAIASTLLSGSIAMFNLANNLSALLVNAIAVSLSTAVFPAMSQAFSRKDTKDFERKFSGAFLQILFLSIPVSVSIFLLRAQIARVVWGWGKVGWLDTRLAAACLGIFALGLFAQGLIFLLSKTFYATHNTKVPAWISVGTVMFNIAMSFFLLWTLSFANGFATFLHAILKLQTVNNISVVGLTLAFTITAICEALLLLYFVHIKLRIFKVEQIRTSVYKIIICAIVMAMVILLVRDSLINFNILSLQTFTGVLLQLVISAIAGSVVYLLAALALKSPELKRIKSLFF